MAVWPVQIDVKPYVGRDERRTRRYLDDLRLAKVIETWLNAQGARQTSRGQIFSYRQIAHELHIDAKTVEKLCGSLDGGGNGFILVRTDIPVDCN
ncbi:MAG: hypothetical protein AB7G62_20645 [Magnetospirillum sp.]